MGPEGGAAGGCLSADGTPEEVAQNSASHTGRYLAEKLGLSPVGESDGKETEGTEE